MSANPDAGGFPATNSATNCPAANERLPLSAGWTSLSDDARVRTAFTDRLLADFLARQRWFAAKGKAIERIAIAHQSPWRDWLWLQVDVVMRDATQTYSLPLAVAWDESPQPAADDVVAAVERPAAGGSGTQSGVIYDAYADARFCRALLAAMRAGERATDTVGGGTLEFSAPAGAGLLTAEAETLPVRRASTSSSNTTLLVGQRLFLKAYRRLAAGINPEVEMGCFLSVISPYAHIAPFAGAVEHRAADGTVSALAIAQGQIASDGDAWSHTLARLKRLLAGGEVHTDAERRHWTTLGLRTGQLHRALAATTGDADFDPQPVSAADLRRWSQQVDDEARQTLAQIERQRAQLPATLQADAQRLLAARPALDSRIARCAALAAQPIDALRTRYHGDYHLGQVLVVGDDFVIIDFEGEPSRPLAERRSRHSPLRDVAGMLRSFNYAAASALASALTAPAAPSGPTPETQAKLATLAADWERNASAAFIAGYAQAMAGCAAYPADVQQRQVLLDLFLLEKALYELRYELGHRPDWVHVPLGGLLGLIGA